MSEALELNTKPSAGEDVDIPEADQAGAERERIAAEKLAETHRALKKALELAAATGHSHEDGEYPSPNARVSGDRFAQEIGVRYREYDTDGKETMYELDMYRHPEATTAVLHGSVVVLKGDAEGHMAVDREITGAEAMEIAAEKGALAAQELGDAAVARVEKLVADYSGEVSAEASQS